MCVYASVCLVVGPVNFAWFDKDLRQYFRQVPDPPRLSAWDFLRERERERETNPRKLCMPEPQHCACWGVGHPTF